MILMFICIILSPGCCLNFNIADLFIDPVIILNADVSFTQLYQEKQPSRFK